VLGRRRQLLGRVDVGHHALRLGLDQRPAGDAADVAQRRLGMGVESGEALSCRARGHAAIGRLGQLLLGVVRRWLGLDGGDRGSDRVRQILDCLCLWMQQKRRQQLFNRRDAIGQAAFDRAARLVPCSL